MEVVGALLTALAFSLGTGAWGLHRAGRLRGHARWQGSRCGSGLPVLVAGVFLNIWFIVALSLAAGYQTSRGHHEQLEAGGGMALWHRPVAGHHLCRTAGPPSASGGPSRPPRPPRARSPVELTRPVVLFAVVRALTVAVAVAIPFGLNVPEAFLMPVATIVALKPEPRAVHPYG